MRKLFVVVSATIIAIVSGWFSLDAIRGLCLTQSVEPINNVIPNLWAWTHCEWRCADVAYIGKHPESFM